MKKLLLSATVIGLSIFTSGCSMHQANESSNKNEFIKYNNEDNIVGNKYNATKKITFSRGDNKKITFYIDKFPYKKEFNLCNKNEFAGQLNKQYKGIKYEINNDPMCKSFLYITKTKDLETPYWTSLKFNFLNGGEYYKKYNLFLESRSREYRLNVFFDNGKNILDEHNKTYLIIEDNI